MRTSKEAYQIFSWLQKQKSYSEKEKSERLKSLIDDEKIMIYQDEQGDIRGVIEYSTWNSFIHGPSASMTISCEKSLDVIASIQKYAHQLILKFQLDGVKMITASVNDETEYIKEMMELSGLRPWYGYVCMKHDGRDLPECSLDKRVIQPEDFQAYCDVMGLCFVPMREAMDIRPYNVTDMFFQTEEKQKETYEGWMENQENTFMYKKDGKWVGSGLLTGEDIDDIFVLPEFQNHGFGREIVYDLVAVAKKKGIMPYIGYVKWNRWAGHLYESCGFVPYLSQTMYRKLL